MFRSFGVPEIILVLVIILIFFGVGKLPQVGNALGKGIRAFRRGQSGEEEDDVEVEKKVTANSSSKKITKSSKTVKES